jgi:hypothetical protein
MPFNTERHKEIYVKLSYASNPTHLRRIRAGLCLRCENKAVTKRFCLEHARKSVVEMKERYRVRKSGHLCVWCGDKLPADRVQITCEPCFSRRRKYNKKTKENFKKRGMCVDCGKPRDSALTRCSSCRTKKNKRDNSRYETRIAAGLCRYCGAMSLKNVKGFCEPCYMKYLAQIHLHSRRRWAELKEKLDTQGRRCAYSGLPLIVGVNASIDHRACVARHPDKKHEASNLHWVDARVNQMKLHFSEEEFLLLCSDVARFSKNRLDQIEPNNPLCASIRSPQRSTFFGRHKKPVSGISPTHRPKT